MTWNNIYMPTATRAPQPMVTGQVQQASKWTNDLTDSQMDVAMAQDTADHGIEPNMVQYTSTGAFGTKGVMLDANDPNADQNRMIAGIKDPTSFTLGKEQDYAAIRSGQYNDLGMYAGDQFSALSSGAAGQAKAAQDTLTGIGADAQAYGAGMGSQLASMGQQQAGHMSGLSQGAGMYGAQAGRAINQTAGLDAKNIAGDAQRRAAGIDAFAGQQAAAGRAAATQNILGERGPSAAQAQLQSGLNQSMGQNLALARSGRGWGNSASALSQAGSQNAAMAQQAVNDSSMLRAREDEAWRGQQLQQAGIRNQAALGYGQQALAGYGAAGGLAQSGLQAGGNLNLQGGLGAAGVTQAGQQMAADIYGQGAGLAQQGMYQGGQLGMQGYGMGLQGAQSGAQAGANGYINAGSLYGQGFNSQMAGMGSADALWANQAQLDQARQDLMMQQYGISQGVGIQSRAQDMQMLGAVTQGVAGFGASILAPAAAPVIIPATAATVKETVSDERAKKNIKAEKGPLLDVGMYGYEYKDPKLPGAAPGRHYGPMAQELERTPAGRSVVKTGRDGVKRVDTGGLTLILASQFSQLHRELDALKTRHEKRAP